MISALPMRPRQATLDYTDCKDDEAPFLLLRRSEPRLRVVEVATRDPRPCAARERPAVPHLSQLVREHRVRSVQQRATTLRWVVASLLVVCGALAAIVVAQHLGYHLPI